MMTSVLSAISKLLVQVDRHDAVAAPGGDQQLAVELNRTRRAVTRSIGAAMHTPHRLKRRIEPDDHSVGTGGRPRLVYAHRADAAALQRLQKAAAGSQRRCDPELARDAVDHVLAI